MDMFNDKIQIFLISERLQHPESSPSDEFLIIATSSYIAYYLSITRLHFAPKWQILITMMHPQPNLIYLSIYCILI